MSDLDFSSLAPRRGTQPLLGSTFGTSDLSGGAINWSGLWSGIKNFGSNIKHWGSKAWNSSTGQALRQKLKDTGFQDKVVEGISTGLHGALDVARQELDRRLEQQLGPRPTPTPEVEPPMTEEEQAKPEPIPAVKPSAPPAFKGPVKRPVADVSYEIQTLDEPPSYAEAVQTPPPLPPKKRPTTRPIAPMVTEVIAPPVQTATTLELARPSQAVVVPPAPPLYVHRPRLSGNWQSKLQTVVGAGLRCSRRRRCY